MNSRYDSDVMQKSEEQPVKKLLGPMTKAMDPVKMKGMCQGPTRWLRHTYLFFDSWKVSGRCIDAPIELEVLFRHNQNVLSVCCSQP